MIYFIKKDNYIFITLEKRNLEDENDCAGELIAATPGDSKQLAIIEENLRPYKDLDSGLVSKYRFCEGSLGKIMTPQKEFQRQTFVYKKNIDEIFSEIVSALEQLKSFGLLEHNLEISIHLEELYARSIYKCDVYNLVYSRLDNASAGLLEKFLSLTKNEKQILSEFYERPTKQDRLDYLKNLVSLNLDDVLEFIPQWYKTNLRLFGIEFSRLDTIKFSSEPEYKDSERLDEMSTVIKGQDLFIKREVYQIFQLGDTWKGKDIKVIFKNIYDKLGTPKNSRVHDIFQYFEVAITRNGYRLISRKII